MFRHWFVRVLAVVLLGMLAFDFSGRQEVTAAPAASPQPGLWVTPLILDFGPVGIGETSPTQLVSIHNTGTATLTNFAGGGVYPPFGASQDCAAGVPPGGTCHYYFDFEPTAAGVFTTTSNSGTNAGSFSIELRGTGVGPLLTYSPLSLDFGSVYSGTTAADQVVTIRNLGLSTLTNFAGGGVYPPFGASQDCAAGVPPGGECHYYFDFTPTASGLFTTTSSSSTNGGPIDVELQGRGRTLFIGSGQRVTPRAVDFGPVGVGLTGDTLVVTITNQSWNFTITDWVGGGVYPPFGALQDCAGGVPPGGECHFYYTFTPSEAGEFSAVSSVSNSFGSFSIELYGTGAGATQTASPLLLDFGPVEPGVTSPVQTVTIHNTGPITLTNWAGGGVYPPFGASQDCAGGVPPGGECRFYYTFSPDREGRFSANSSFSTNAGSINIQLVGGAPLKSFLPLVSK